MTQKAIYPGTFDPITNGHVDLITRAASIFPELIVAVAENTGKAPHWSFQQRIRLVRSCVAHLPQVIVLGFDGLLVDFAQTNQAHIMVRGLRSVADFDYEMHLAGMNRKLSPQIETLFLMPSEQHLFVSSSLVREIAKLKGDITPFVPEPVAKELKS